MATKITKADNFNAIRDILVDVGRPELVEFIDHELELISRKAERRANTPTKAQIEGARLRSAILEVLRRSGEPMTISQIITALNWGSPLTPQKISPQLSNLGEHGTREVVKEVIKKINYYKAV